MRDTGTQYRGPLAGLGAGAAAVLVLLVVVLLAWHRIAGQVSGGIVVLVYVAVGAACAVPCLGLVYAVLWLRHRVRHPETLAPRHAPEPAPPAITAAEPRAIEPPRAYLNLTDDQFAALMRHHAGEE